jgi:hypothetical protein
MKLRVLRIIGPKLLEHVGVYGLNEGGVSLGHQSRILLMIFSSTLGFLNMIHMLFIILSLPK